MTKTAVSILAIMAVAAIVAPWMSPHPPLIPAGDALQPPSPACLLGTDDVGRDLFSQLLAGARVSLLVGVLAGVAATLIGGVLGVVAGYYGGLWQAAVMRVVDIFLALPRLPLLLLLAAYLGGGPGIVILAFACLGWAVPARMVCAQVRLERTRAYVITAQLAGARLPYLLRRHLLPGLAPLLVAIVLMEVGQAVMVEAGLSFLGLGDPTVVSWGAMLHHAFRYSALFLTDAWLWWAVPPGLCLAGLLLSLALLNMTLEHRLDPRLQGGARIE